MNLKGERALEPIDCLFVGHLGGSWHSCAPISLHSIRPYQTMNLQTNIPCIYYANVRISQLPSTVLHSSKTMKFHTNITCIYYASVRISVLSTVTTAVGHASKQVPICLVVPLGNTPRPRYEPYAAVLYLPQDDNVRE